MNILEGFLYVFLLLFVIPFILIWIEDMVIDYVRR